MLKVFTSLKILGEWGGESCISLSCSVGTTQIKTTWAGTLERFRTLRFGPMQISLMFGLSPHGPGPGRGQTETDYGIGVGRCDSYDSKSYKISPAMMECCQGRLKIALQGSLARWQFQNDVKCVDNNCDGDVDCDCDCDGYCASVVWFFSDLLLYEGYVFFGE